MKSHVGCWVNRLPLTLRGGFVVAANQQKYRAGLHLQLPSNQETESSKSYNTYGTLTPGYFIPFWGIWKLPNLRLRIGILYRYLRE